MPGNWLRRTAPAPLSVGCAVRALAANEVAPANARAIEHLHSVLGVTLTGTTAAGQELVVIRTGEITNSAWSWEPHKPVFLDADGRLTQTFDPTWVFLCVMGVASSATTVVVGVQTPVVL